MMWDGPVTHAVVAACPCVEWHYRTVQDLVALMSTHQALLTCHITCREVRTTVGVAGAESILLLPNFLPGLTYPKSDS